MVVPLPYVWLDMPDWFAGRVPEVERDKVLGPNVSEFSLPSRTLSELVLSLNTRRLNRRQ